MDLDCDLLEAYVLKSENADKVAEAGIAADHALTARLSRMCETVDAFTEKYEAMRKDLEL